MNNPIKILVVDDDKKLRDLLKRYLSEQGYQILVVADGREMDTILATQQPDLMILDLMLPGEDGLSIAHRITLEKQIPIIILSAKGDDVEKIIGLETGADDYLAKPFNPRELLARIRAVLRRQQKIQQPLKEKNIEQYTFGDFILDNTSRRLLHQQQEISLTSGEFNLLFAFVTHPNRALSRDQLMDMVKGYERLPFDRSIDIHITRLRKKIEINPKEAKYIRTVWGVGYIFTPQGKSD